VTELDDVLERSRRLGFLGPGSLAMQVEHAEGFAAGVDDVPDRWLDLGSGGGVPGLVLAGIWTGSSAVLLDASEKRCAFLDEAVRALGWGDRVSVVRGRAEEVGRLGGMRATFDVVVARGFGPPAVTAECGAPFLALGGCLVVSEPPPAGSGEERWPEDGLARLGLTPHRSWRLAFGYRSFLLASPCPDGFPRRVGVPAKRPLF
jgi:16S rRNA (guanine527-N7)-methyltransferase